METIVPSIVIMHNRERCVTPDGESGSKALDLEGQGGTRTCGTAALTHERLSTASSRIASPSSPVSMPGTPRAMLPGQGWKVTAAFLC